MDNETNTTTNTGKKGSNGKWVSQGKGGAEAGATDQSGGVLETARKAYDQVADKAGEYIAPVGEHLAPAGEFVSSINTRATGFVRSYPLQAAIGGLVIGFLLGSMVSRRQV
jgi:hypothetical protein